MGSKDTSIGNLMLDPVTTPIVNIWHGPTADRTYSLFTGRGWNANGTLEYFIDEIGSIRSVDTGNGVIDTSNAYAWLNEQLWTGSEWKTV